MQTSILVTGGAGFIGSCFVNMAIRKGYRVIVLDALTYAGHRENLDWIDASPEQMELVVGNICDGPLVSRLLKEHAVRYVVNFAAESHVDNSIERPSEFIETNILGCYTLLEAARAYWNDLKEREQQQFRFLHVSTDEVYGSLGEVGKFTENSPIKPNSPYSASKAAGDLLARAWHETYKLPALVTNCTNNYGPRQHPEKLIPRMITNALAGEALPVYGDGKNIRDWIHVEDHCQGVMLAMEKGLPGETYCFGGDEEKTNVEVVHAICEALQELAPLQTGDHQDYKELISFVTDRPGHDRRYAIDDSKAQELLGFTRQYDFNTGLRDTVQWYLDNHDWCASVMKQAA